MKLKPTINMSTYVKLQPSFSNNSVKFINDWELYNSCFTKSLDYIFIYQNSKYKMYNTNLSNAQHERKWS